MENVMKSLMGLIFLLSTAAFAADAPSVPKPVSLSKTYLSPGGSVLRPLTEPTAFGGAEVEVGELTFPPNSDSGDHQHSVTETFYVLEGELEHVVNGKSLILKPGMVGSVRPPDKVRHKTGAAGGICVRLALAKFRRPNLRRNTLQRNAGRQRCIRVTHWKPSADTAVRYGGKG
jgi:quercetin dioxygenase-like cupin family protein